MLKNWNDPKKLKSRRETIIAAYRRLSKRQRIPADRQYWTMCGLCDGIGTEYDQITKSGLTQPDQFHGVEIDRQTHSRNKKAHPNDGNWYCGDFYLTMEKAFAHGEFRPAIINLDTLKTPEVGWDDLREVLNLLNEVPLSNIMVIGNFILDSWRIGKREFPELQLNSGWKVATEYYEYPGTGRGFVMGTLIFWKGGEK